MQLPVKITYRGLEKSGQIDNLVLDYAACLEKFCDHINRCDIAVEQTNHTHQKGNPYRCRIDVTVSRGHELVADERQMDNGTHKPLNKVIHDAFKTMDASCVALWKSKGEKYKPTPTHVRRNNCSDGCHRRANSFANCRSYRPYAHRHGLVFSPRIPAPFRHRHGSTPGLSTATGISQCKT